jgi:hypothetical protein
MPFNNMPFLRLMDLEHFNLHDFYKADRARLKFFFFFFKKKNSIALPPLPSDRAPIVMASLKAGRR